MENKDENLHSNTENIEDTARIIMDAFKENNIEADQVLKYENLYPYLHEHSQHRHYKDVQKEAEHHLRKEGYATPEPDGLRLTPVGYKAINGQQE
jgi:hypothetical protein